MNISFTELEELKKHLADSLGEALEKKIDPLVKRIETVEAQGVQVNQIQQDVANLKKNQARALVGWSVLCVGVTLIFNQIKGWFLSKFRIV